MDQQNWKDSVYNTSILMRVASSSVSGCSEVCILKGNVCRAPVVKFI